MTFYIAECQDCRPVLPIPFDEIEKRDAWASEHSNAVGHSVTVRTETRGE